MEALSYVSTRSEQASENSALVSVHQNGDELELRLQPRTDQQTMPHSLKFESPVKKLRFPDSRSSKPLERLHFISALDQQSFEQSWTDENGKRRKISTLSMSFDSFDQDKVFCSHCQQYVSTYVKYLSDQLPFWKRILCRECLQQSYTALHSCCLCNSVLTKVKFNASS